MSSDKKWIVLLLILCLSACSIKLFPTKDEWYTKHYIIMQEFEWKVYKELSPAGKLEFQKLFWEARDPDSQVIFMNRMDAVLEHFKKENVSKPWNTDRGRIYLLNGNPAEIRYVENTTLGGIDIVSSGEAAVLGEGRNIDRSGEDIGARMSEVWRYPYKNTMIVYQFSFQQPHQWKLNTRMSESLFLEEFEQRSREKTYGVIDMEDYLRRLEEFKNIK